MKHKYLLTTSVAVLAAISSYALPRTPHEARELAAKVFGKINPEAKLMPSQNQTRSDETNYYVFDANDSQGFVIVASDNRFEDILGYATEGSFSDIQENPAFANWLTAMSAEMASADEFEPRVTRGKTSAPDVAPLLTTKWGQNAPYNKYCFSTYPGYRPPIGWKPSQAVTGCVATAMAQVMRYHKWPQSFTNGSDTFNYDWDLMADSYSGSESDEAIEQVARLMNHCGISVNMKYGESESGASTFAINPAMVERFGYDGSTIRKVMRNSYGYDELHEILYTELTAGRPVIVGGEYPGVDGGHQFVLDGCNPDGLFHINWGWNGYCDGFYRITSLRPEDYGTGGNQEGFSFEVDFTVGIQPKRNIDPDVLNGQLTPMGELQLNDDSSETVTLDYSNNGSFYVTTIGGEYAGFMSTGNGTFHLNLITRLENLKTGEIKDIPVPVNGSLSPGYYTNALPMKYSDVANNWQPEYDVAYKATLCYRLSDESPVEELKFGPGLRSHLILERHDNVLKITQERMESGITAEIDPDVQRIIRRYGEGLPVTVSNPSGIEFLGGVKCVFTDAYGNEVSKLTSHVMANLRPGDTSTETFYLYNLRDVEEGSYTVTLQDFRNRVLCNPRTVEIYDFKLTLDPTNFPDAAFREYIAAKYDTDNDGALSDVELAEGTVFEMGNLPVADFTGIEHFFNAYRLEMDGNPSEKFTFPPNLRISSLTMKNSPISSINLESFPKLEYVNFYQTGIESLDFSGFPELYYIEVQNNKLKNLVLPSSNKLELLYCYSNQLTKLDLRGYDKLVYLSADYNSIEDLKFNALPSIKRFYIQKNKLQGVLDVSGLSSLTELLCSANELTGLKLGSLENLKELSARDNKIEEFTFGNLPALEQLNLSKNNLSGSLDMSSLSNLTYLNLCENKLTSVSLGSHPMMETLELEYNSLTGEMDFTDLPNLTRLYIYNNPELTAILGTYPSLTVLNTWGVKIAGGVLNLSGSPKVSDVYVDNCALKSIVFENHPYLLYLDIYDNEIEGTLDISGMPALIQLAAQNNRISRLIHANNPAITRINIWNNALTHFQADDFPALTSFTCYGQKPALSITTPNFNTKTLASTGFDYNRTSEWWASWEEDGERRYHECNVISGVVMIPDEAGRDVELDYKYLVDAANNDWKNFTLFLTREGFNSVEFVTDEGNITIDGNNVSFPGTSHGEIYTLTGMKVFSGTGTAEALPRGQYIVVSGGKSFKILIP